MKKKREALREFERLIGIVEKLGGRGGCPWDRSQTFESLRQCLVEETAEVLEAVQAGDREMLRGELGDLLYIILFYARLADAEGSFHLRDVFREIADKLVRRHPLVFEEKRQGTISDAHRLWHERKKREKGQKKKRTIFDGIPPALPALYRAQKVQRKAARTGFDWNKMEDLLPKLNEESEEFLESLKQGKKQKAREELGDLFFTLVNIARFLDADPEAVLDAATKKFIRRYLSMEKQLHQKGKDPASCTLEEMDAVWEKIKKEEK